MLDGARRRRITLPGRGIELAVLDWGGKGPLALVHHANGFCGAVYAPIVHPLRDTHRIVLYDARGHGDSTQPPPGDAYRWTVFPEDLLALAEVLIAEGPQRSVALGIGHSFGGTATAVAAAARPELFERIVLLDPVLHPRPRSP
ncbi:MAG: alpha/beta fold hydrolase [Myxococcota bacterium]